MNCARFGAITNDVMFAVAIVQKKTTRGFLTIPFHLYRANSLILTWARKGEQDRLVLNKQQRTRTHN